MKTTSVVHGFVWIFVLGAHAHSSYLSDVPNLKDEYFSQWGSGAVGHDGGVGGARLNSFGETFKRGALTKCAVTDDDDDDDDDDDHHSKWGTKMCCADSDGDGLTNGEEVGDPCCEWKKGRSEPWSNYNVSHPALATERTTERRVCNGTVSHRKPPCQPWPPSPGPTPPAPPTPPSPSHNECNPAKTCNVCSACCHTYIEDGSECDNCVNDECPPSPTPAPPTKPECQPAQGCNVCSECCKPYIKDGLECLACEKLQCKNASHVRRHLFVQGHNARAVLHETGLWHQTANLTEANLIWVRNRCVIGNYSGRPGQAINRLDFDRTVASKALLAALLGALPVEQRSFLPRTLPLATPADARAVTRALMQDQQVWILKPADLSKGLGVVPVPQPAAWVQGGGAQRVVDTGRVHVLQRYVENPLLLDGFKSEVRVYFLVASVAPLRVLWFPEGSIRLAAQRFAATQWDNPLVHVVNTAAGKRKLGAVAYAKLVADQPRKWTFAEVAAHLKKNATLARLSGVGGDPWQHVLGQMKRAIAVVTRAAAPSMQKPGNRSKTWHPFALMGADFLLDDKLKAWLTEVQEGPGLSHVAERVKEDFVPSMVKEAALIGVEAATRLASGDPTTLQGLEAGTRFQVLV
jgi:hypothetical protein